MIALSLDDCRIKITYYAEELAQAERAMKYLQQPDKKREHHFLAKIRQHELAARQETDPRMRGINQELAEAARERLQRLPQNMSDDDLAEVLAQHKETMKRCQGKLRAALDELELLEAKPELIEQRRKHYADLPPGVIGEPLLVLDDGTTLLYSGMVMLGDELELYRVRKVFVDADAVDIEQTGITVERRSEQIEKGDNVKTTKQQIIELWSEAEKLISEDEHILDVGNNEAMMALNNYLACVADLKEHLKGVE